MPAISPAGGPYGERLVPHIVDGLALSHPERIYAKIPRTADVNDGFRDVSMKELANAINVMSWILEQVEGKPSEGVFERIAYIGASDIRYVIMMIAAIKVGYVVLLPSARNSLAGNISLLRETKCTKVFYSSDMSTRVQDWKREKPELDLFRMEGLYDLLGKAPPKHYRYEKSFADAFDDPSLICHTSGSTGAPKPITLSNATWGILDNLRKIPTVDGRRNMDYSCFEFNDNGNFICSFPPFHIGGMQSQVVLPILYRSTLVMFPPDQPATGETLSAIMSQMKVRVAYCPPAILEQLVRVPAGLEQAAKLDFIMYAGGPLAPFAGDQLSKVTDVGQMYGSTETGIVPCLFPRREHWAWFEWHPAYGVDMQHQGNDIYEQVLNHDARLTWIRTVQQTFPGVKEWRTKDLFGLHPTNRNLWQYRGRTDDVLVLSNGEKLNPLGMEKIIESHPAVMGAIIVGQSRFQPSLLIEPRVQPEDTESFVEEIWPTVQMANAYGPAHGKISKTYIAVSTSGKPFIRAGKGTIVRQKTTDLYASGIDQLYYASSARKMRDIPTLRNPQDPVALRQFLVDYITRLLPHSADVETGDFFNVGLDSLLTMELATGLQYILTEYLGRAHARLINVKLIYSNPTLETLSSTLSAHLRRDPVTAGRATDFEAERISRMSELCDKYTKGLPQQPLQPRECSTSKNDHDDQRTSASSVNNSSSLSRNTQESCLNIILTGSTGSLGSRILQALVKSRHISHIHCLNRSVNAKSRHVKDFESRGVQVDLSNVTFHTASFGDVQFGLSTEAYKNLLTTVDLIIHNAWKVDFNHSLSSFEDIHIRGVRRFVDFVIDGARRPKFTFVSSIGSVGKWTTYYPDHPLVTEEPLQEYGVAQTIGYGESKHVSERILQVAAERSGITANILRVGQIAGPLTTDGGKWNENEWMPSLIKTSKAMGCIPNKVLQVDWIPVDVLANIIVDITLAKKEGLQIYNLVNPRVADWSSLTEVIVEQYPGMQVVTLEEWVDKLIEGNKDDQAEVELKPALKILDWFIDLEKALNSTSSQQNFETRNSVTVSQTMAQLRVVNGPWMKIWLDQWAF
ncbi:hypothetical protein EDD37DRAFT_672726 [Exophiala viscosa]|uniref:uncharacterized protein n=1 Tax=Exophiala viscosa TaxID=2486360 RepID=UPI00219CEDCE|nr:hypothetical protein EDD37DRAFT_672726 [Exophiala viscosa]